MKKLLIILLLIGLSLSIIISVLEMPSVGSIESPSYNEVATYYINNALHDTKSPNVVTAVLKYYRGVDTLLEAGVLFTAIVAVLSVLRGNETVKKEEKVEKQHG